MRRWILSNAHTTPRGIMTNTRSTEKETQRRNEKAADLLAEGIQPCEVVKMMADEFMCSKQAARKYVEKGKQIIIDDINPKDRAFMFAQAYNNVLQDRLDAKEAGNLNVQSGSTKSLIKLITSVTTLDQVGCWDSEVEASDLHVFKNFSDVKSKTHRHSDLDALDNSDLPF